jgi:hypothetical protein
MIEFQLDAAYVIGGSGSRAPAAAALLAIISRVDKYRSVTLLPQVTQHLFKLFFCYLAFCISLFDN